MLIINNQSKSIILTMGNQYKEQGHIDKRKSVAATRYEQDRSLPDKGIEKNHFNWQYYYQSFSI